MDQLSFTNLNVISSQSLTIKEEASVEEEKNATTYCNEGNIMSLIQIKTESALPHAPLDLTTKYISKPCDEMRVCNRDASESNAVPPGDASPLKLFPNLYHVLNKESTEQDLITETIASPVSPFETSPSSLGYSHNLLIEDTHTGEGSRKTATEVDVGNQEVHTCTECDKSFSRSYGYKCHMRMHKVKQSMCCTLCDKSFVRLDHLNAHMRTHTGEKAFSCKECGMLLSCLSAGKRHMRTHTNEKPFPCSECGKTFTQPFSLTRHMLTHTGEKPYVCKYCNKAFTTSSDLSRHTNKLHKC